MNIFIRNKLACLLAGIATAAAGMDDARLKEWLYGNFIAPESMRWEEIDEFKQNFSVTDEQLYRILMGVYLDAEGKWATLTPKTTEWNNNNRTVEGVLGWLPKCGDIPVKDFLMDYSTKEENESWLRRSAILSYLRKANAEEAKNALLRFLVEGDRMDYMERLSIYEYAKMVYGSADEQKRAAILNTLYVAAAVSDLPPLEFRVCDEILVKLSSAYAQSCQRFALLNKFNSISYPENRKETKKILKERLESMQKFKVLTNVSTNLMLLKSRNFNLPQPGLATSDTMAAVEDNSVADEKTDSGTRRSVGTYAFFGVTALLLLGFGAWKLTRR